MSKTSPLHFGRGSCKESVYSPTQKPYGKQVSAVHNSRFSDELDSADQWSTDGGFEIQF